MTNKKFEQYMRSIPRANDGLLVLSFVQEVEATRALEAVRCFGADLQRQYDQHAALKQRMEIEILRRMRGQAKPTKRR